MHTWTRHDLNELAELVNPVVRGFSGGRQPVARRCLDGTFNGVLRRVSWGAVLVAGSCSCSSARDRGIRDAGFPSEVAVRGEVLDGSG